jgi:hypothetical protein
MTPLERFLDEFDRLDADACAAVFAPDGRLRFADGRVEHGTAAIRAALRGYFADLRSTDHRMEALWHVESAWIAEVDANYVLADHSLHGPVSKVFVARMRADLIDDLRVYAAGEPSFHEAAVRHELESGRGTFVGGRWMPPL